MNVNGVSNYSISNQFLANATEKEKNETEAVQEKQPKKEDVAAIYEPSNESVKKKNTEIVAQLKMEQEERTKQLLDIVRNSIKGQGNSFSIATTNDMWKILASGKFTVDAATKKKAQEDISEDGYWGVKKTSDRIVDFAKALTGGDASKIEEMRKAFEKGFKQATKTWGKELPSISKDTYKAVMDKFDAWKKEASGSSTDADKKEDSTPTDISIQMNTDN